MKDCLLHLSNQHYRLSNVPPKLSLTNNKRFYREEQHSVSISLASPACRVYSFTSNTAPVLTNPSLPSAALHGYMRRHALQMSVSLGYSLSLVLQGFRKMEVYKTAKPAL